MNNDIGEYCHTNIVIATQKRGCLVHHFKQQFLVSKQHYTYFHTFFIHTYFHTCFQTTKHMFLSAYTKHPLKQLLENNFNN